MAYSGLEAQPYRCYAEIFKKDRYRVQAQRDPYSDQRRSSVDQSDHQRAEQLAEQVDTPHSSIEHYMPDQFGGGASRI